MLPRTEKSRLAQLLADKPVREEDSTGLGEGAEYPIWSSSDCADGGSALQGLLDEEKAR